MAWLPVDRAAMSRALTSGMPPDSSVASVRANLRRREPAGQRAEVRQPQNRRVQPPALRRLPEPQQRADHDRAPGRRTIRPALATRFVDTATTIRVDSGSSAPWPNCA